ncbi:hypothetical protein [Streptococcus thermophilus]|uniref:hypothetical protein n=1 Tax=Streptococcus thermophilus TaxID=1308 RepID=UPI003A80768A
MNKRQRKKQYTRAFSKAYDESLKYKHFERNISISTFTSAKGIPIMFLSLNKSINLNVSYDELSEISIDGCCVDYKPLKEWHQ